MVWVLVVYLVAKYLVPSALALMEPVASMVSRMRDTRCLRAAVLRPSKAAAMLFISEEEFDQRFEGAIAADLVQA